MRSTIAPRSLWWFGAAALAAGLGIVLWLTGSLDATESGARLARVDCDASGRYGDAVTCNIVADADLTIDWGDGTREAVNRRATLTHAVRAAGTVAVQVFDGDDLASETTVDIAPDLTVECDTTSEEPQPVYELMAASDSGVRNVWDYVYLDGEGRRVEPGDENHPVDPGFTDLSPIVLDMVPRTRTCVAHSDALDDLGGELYWTIESEWYVPTRSNLRSPLISLHGDWAGIQPGSVTATVTVNDLEVSERVGVYSSGCT